MDKYSSKILCEIFVEDIFFDKKYFENFKQFEDWYGSVKLNFKIDGFHPFIKNYHDRVEVYQLLNDHKIKLTTWFWKNKNTYYEKTV